MNVPARCTATLVILLFPAALLAQPSNPMPAALVTSSATPDTAIDVPPVHGLNFVLSTNSQYDDGNGWSSELSPSLSFRVTRHISFDTGLPYYLAVNAVQIKGTKAATVYVPTTAHGVIGDTAVSAHLDLNGPSLSYSFTATGAFPTGNAQYNLSANASTYALTNHFERSFDWFTPDIELGEGDSSSLNGKVRKAYIAVGPLAMFQAGGSFDLPHNLGLEFEAYEDMPIGNQNVYGTITTKKGKTKSVLQGTGVAEDNGFNLACSFPLNAHLNASAFFNRSLRQYDNTTGFSFTYTLRVPPTAK